MDELEISGKRYISTRRAAREHGYHSDYMGQLIRGKKVAGQKVGRAWYIEEDSLNAYLGNAPAPMPEAAVKADTELAPGPRERLIIEEPAQPVVLKPQPVIEAPAPEPVLQEPEVIATEEAQPIAVRIEPHVVEPAHVQPVVQEIHHAPYVEERETRIPVHIQAMPSHQMGGLRYAADEYPSIPMVTRMPQAPAQAAYASIPRSRAGKFPYASLSVVGVVAILAATFASNFISVTVVSEQGKAATVQYAIHW